MSAETKLPPVSNEERDAAAREATQKSTARSERSQTERDIAQLTETGPEGDESADEAQVARLLRAASDDLPKLRLSDKTLRQLESQALRRKQLAAVRVSDADIAELANAVYVSKAEAEQLLREANGDLNQALRTIIRWELPSGAGPKTAP
jgi:NACalpha-BTF3-like transcription factor